MFFQAKCWVPNILNSRIPIWNSKFLGIGWLRERMRMPVANVHKIFLVVFP